MVKKNQNIDDEIDIIDLVRVFARNKLILLVSTAIGFISGIIAIFLIPNNLTISLPVFPIGTQDLIYYSDLNSLPNPHDEKEFLFDIDSKILENIFHETLLFSSVVRDSLIESGFVDPNKFNTQEELDQRLYILESQFDAVRSEYKNKQVFKPGHLTFTGVNEKKINAFFDLLIIKTNVKVQSELKKYFEARVNSVSNLHKYFIKKQENKINLIIQNTNQRREDVLVRLKSHLKIAEALGNATSEINFEKRAASLPLIRQENDGFHIMEPLHKRGYLQLKEEIKFLENIEDVRAFNPEILRVKSAMNELSIVDFSKQAQEVLEKSPISNLTFKAVNYDFKHKDIKSKKLGHIAFFSLLIFGFLVGLFISIIRNTIRL
jgi:LPS O-antigen subunit length determinant protein (WzzB/FepE family)